MSTVLYVETNAWVETYPDGDPVKILADRGVKKLVSVTLGTDGKEMASLHFDPTDTDDNTRATRMTGALCGSFVRVTGPAAFLIEDDQWAETVIAATAREEGEQDG